MTGMKIILTIGVAFLVLTGCSHDTLAPAGSGLLETTEVVVSAETSGRVQQLRFDEGSVVNIADTLAVIDPSRTELELASARAGRGVAVAGLQTARLQLDQTRERETYALSERDRVAQLLKSGTATQREMDRLDQEYTQTTIARKTAAAGVATVEAELEKIDADIARLRRVLNDSYPLAPVSGTITEKYVEQGELLAPGRAIAKIAQLDSLWVKVYLPAGDFSHIKLGDEAKVDTESGGGVYNGIVVWTSEEAEFTPKNVQTEKSRANLVYAVKIALANEDGTLKVGMPVYVTIGQ